MNSREPEDAPLSMVGAIVSTVPLLQGGNVRGWHDIAVSIFRSYSKCAELMNCEPIGKGGEHK